MNKKEFLNKVVKKRVWDVRFRFVVKWYGIIDKIVF